MSATPKTTCLRCGGEMQCRGAEKILLGETGFFSGTWSSLMAGAMEVQVFVCSQCGKMEFYANDGSPCMEEPTEEIFDAEQMPVNEEGTPQKFCPNCGQMQDFDYPVCPFCNYKYAIAN